MEDYNNEGYKATYRPMPLFGIPGMDYNMFFANKPDPKDKPDLSNTAFFDTNKKKEEKKK